MSEREHITIHEREKPADESLAEHGRERHAELEKRLENSQEKSRDAKSEKEQAREKIELINHEKEKAAAEKETRAHEKERLKQPERVTKSARKAAYKHTMKEVEHDLPAVGRAYSKFIHNRVVEKTSEVLGDTVVRPNAVLAGAIVAFVFTSVIYIIARHYGYPLSGFETIAAAIIGWIVGTMFDFVRIMVTGKK